MFKNIFYIGLKKKTLLGVVLDIEGEYVTKYNATGFERGKEDIEMSNYSCFSIYAIAPLSSL